MKKGVALLITIGFVILMLSITAYLFNFSDIIFKESEKIKIQTQNFVIFKDMKVLLDKYSSDVESSEDLSELLVGIPYFNDKKSGLSFSIAITPLSNKIDVNAILKNKKVDKQIVEFIKSICETYNVLQADFLLSLILDTIDTDLKPREIFSEIANDDTTYSNGAIYNKDHYNKLIKYYIEITNDTNILKVPWDKFIYFGLGKKGILDCDRLSKEMLWVLGVDSEEYSGCETFELDDYKAIRTKYNLKSFNKENNYYILVKIIYKIENQSDGASFIYDIKDKKVSSFGLY